MSQDQTDQPAGALEQDPDWDNTPLDQEERAASLAGRMAWQDRVRYWPWRRIGLGAGLAAVLVVLGIIISFTVGKTGFDDSLMARYEHLKDQEPIGYVIMAGHFGHPSFVDLARAMVKPEDEALYLNLMRLYAPRDVFMAELEAIDPALKRQEIYMQDRQLILLSAFPALEPALLRTMEGGGLSPALAALSFRPGYLVLKDGEADGRWRFAVSYPVSVDGSSQPWMLVGIVSILHKGFGQSTVRIKEMRLENPEGTIVNRLDTSAGS